MSTLTTPGQQSAHEAAKSPTASYATTPGLAHFWLRRIHSLAGILFGGYVAVHLIVNATGWWPKAYQQNVDKIHSLEPMLPLIEILFIFLPLAIHLIYGVYISIARVDYGSTTHYSYGGNVRYVLQRVSGIILLAFLVYHVGTLHRWGFTLLGLQARPAFVAENVAYQTTVQALKAPYAEAAANVAVIVLYLVGIWAATFHFANGLWTAAIAWGLTTTRASQKRWGNACLAAGVGLTLIGTAAWAAFCIAGNMHLSPSVTRTTLEVSAVEAPGPAGSVHPHVAGPAPAEFQPVSAAH